MCFLPWVCASITSAQTDSPFLDEAFRPPHTTSPSISLRAEALTNGDIITSSFDVAGSLATERSLPNQKFFADGTRDTMWEARLAAGGRIEGGWNMIQALNGGVYLVGPSENYRNYGLRYVVEKRLANGELDSQFAPFYFTTDNSPRALALHSDGRLLVAGFFSTINGSTRAGIFRLNANGTLDTTFASSTMQALSGVWNRPVIDRAGRIYLVGDFTSFGGQSRPGLVRLNPDGTVDTTFIPTGFTASALGLRAAGLQSGDRLVVGGRFTVQGVQNIPLVRLLESGGLDSQFVAPARSSSTLRDFLVNPNDSILAVDSTLVAYDANGALLSPSAWVQPQMENRSLSSPASVLSIQRLANGDFMAAGGFDRVNGQERLAVATFSPSGQLRPLSLPAFGSMSAVRSFARLFDGRSLAVYQSATAPAMALLGTDGRSLPLTELTSQLPDFDSARDVAQLGTGEIWLLYSDPTGQSVKLARLSASGSVQVIRTVPNTLNHLNRLFPLSDGGLLRWSDASLSAIQLINGAAVLAKYDANGIEVPAYSPELPDKLTSVERAAPIAPETVGEIVALHQNFPQPLLATPQGSVYFSYTAIDRTQRVVRTFSQGSQDQSFQVARVNELPRTSSFTSTLVQDPLRPAAPGMQLRVTQAAGRTLTSAVLQQDGSLVIVGRFNSLNNVPANSIARVSASGLPDPAFQLALGSGPALSATFAATGTEYPNLDGVVLGPEDRLLIVGNFSTWSGAAAPGLVRLLATGSRDPAYLAPAARASGMLLTTTSLLALPDGSVALSGPFSVRGEIVPRGLLRLTHDDPASLQRLTYGGSLSGGGHWAALVESNRSGTLVVGLPDRTLSVVTSFTVNQQGAWNVGPTTAAKLVSRTSGDAITVAAVQPQILGRWENNRLAFEIPEWGITVSSTPPDAHSGTGVNAGLYTLSPLNATDGTGNFLLRTNGTVLVLAKQPSIVALTSPVTTMGAEGNLGFAGSLANGLQLSGTIANPTRSASLTVTTPGNAPLAMTGGADATRSFVRFVNISTRAAVGSNDRSMITGFVIAGTGSRPFLVRATGPALAEFGVQGALADPQFELIRLGSGGSNTSVGTTNDWSGNDVEQAAARLGAFPLKAGSKDAAQVYLLPPGGYTAVVTPAGGSGGEGLVEVYDAAVDDGSSRLINISTRTELTPASPVMIAGFVVQGPIARRMLIRGIGPTLKNFGLNGTLEDPVLTLYRVQSSGTSEQLAVNDDWSTNAAAGVAIEAVAASVQAFPLSQGSKDATLYLTLPPGGYTAHLGGKGGFGIGMIEVYEAP